jgi:hypothetical protein
MLDMLAHQPVIANMYPKQISLIDYQFNIIGYYKEIKAIKAIKTGIWPKARRIVLILN